MPAFTTNIHGCQITLWLAAADARSHRLSPKATGTPPQPAAATASDPPQTAK